MHFRSALPTVLLLVFFLVSWPRLFFSCNTLPQLHRNQTVQETADPNCAAIGEITDRRKAHQDAEEVVTQLNRMIGGWGNYFCLGPVSRAYRAVEQHGATGCVNGCARNTRCQDGRLPSSPMSTCIGRWA